MTDNLTFESRKIGSSTVFFLSGRLDHKTVFDLQKAVRNSCGAAGREIVFDFNEVAWIDSLAMGVLLSLRRHLDAEGKVMVLANCKGMLLDALHLAKFHKIFEIR